MGVFSSYYKSGFMTGVAVASVLSVWLYNRESIYLRVKADLENEKKHH